MEIYGLQDHKVLLYDFSSNVLHYFAILSPDKHLLNHAYVHTHVSQRYISIRSNSTDHAKI
uniref:Uncharacterized protein n=1 Tax=Rhizophora mucronata TaxID=61149 RepID=A0A2P2NWW3_RHIMU